MRIGRTRRLDPAAALAAINVGQPTPYYTGDPEPKEKPVSASSYGKAAERYGKYGRIIRAIREIQDSPHWDVEPEQITTDLLQKDPGVFEGIDDHTERVRLVREAVALAAKFRERVSGGDKSRLGLPAFPASDRKRQTEVSNQLSQNMLTGRERIDAQRRGVDLSVSASPPDPRIDAGLALNSVKPPAPTPQRVQDVADETFLSRCTAAEKREVMARRQAAGLSVADARPIDPVPGAIDLLSAGPEGMTEERRRVLVDQTLVRMGLKPIYSKQ
jgi:hypothetical protein